MAFTAVAVARGGCWVKRMLTLAVIAFVSVNGIASTDISSEEQVDVGIMGDGLVEMAPTESSVPIGGQLDLPAGENAVEKKSLFGKKYLVAITVLLLAVGLMAYTGKAHDHNKRKERLEKEKREKEKEKEKERREREKREKRERREREREKREKEEMLMTVLDGVMENLLATEERLKTRFETTLMDEFKAFRLVLAKVRDAVTRNDYDKVAALLAEPLETKSEMDYQTEYELDYQSITQKETENPSQLKSAQHLQIQGSKN